jgi:hypothetical protein
MSCDPCSPKAIVTCLELSTDKYLFHIHGLENGIYYWRLTNDQGKVFSKQFTYTATPYSGYTLEILASEVPAGLFFAARTLWFSITKDIGGLSKVPFLFAQYVEEVQVEIVCDEFAEDNNEVGIDVMY